MPISTLLEHSFILFKGLHFISFQERDKLACCSVEYCQNGLIAVFRRISVGPTRLLLILPGIQTRNILIYYFLVLLAPQMDNCIHNLFSDILSFLQPILLTNPLLLLCHTCTYLTKQPSKYHTLLHLPQRNIKIQIPIFAFNPA